MTNEILKKIQGIKERLEKSVQDKSVIKLSVYNNLVEDIKENLELIKKNHSQEERERIVQELKNTYKWLIVAYGIIQTNCWDSYKHSLNNSEPLSDEYNIKAAYENLSTMVKVLELFHNDDLCKTIIDSDKDIPLRDITSLQGKMKIKLEEMQRQQSPQSATSQDNDVNKYSDGANENEYHELEKKANAEFGKYIENGAIDSISIAKTLSGNLCATIKLKDNDNENTSIKISEFLNSKFCTENNIASFSILNSDKERVMSGHVDKGIRYYDLSTMAQYGIKFNWYIGERECSITLSANNDGSIKIVGDKPADEDLEKNKDVRIKVGDAYLSLVDAVKAYKQNSKQRNEDSNGASSELNQPSVSPLVNQREEQINAR